MGLLLIFLLVPGRADAQLSCPYSQTCDYQFGPAFHFTNSNVGGSGLRGDADGSGTGVQGNSFTGAGVNAASGSGTGLVAASVSGNLIVGQNLGGNVFRVNNTGDVFANSYTTGGADVAEFIRSEDRLEPGDVVEIDLKHPGQFRKAAKPYSTAVAGVISTKPGLTMNSKNAADSDQSGPQLALLGRVPVRATAKNGAIRPGDMLVASSMPGHAMRAGASPKPGTVIGKALGNLESGAGRVEMLIWSR